MSTIQFDFPEPDLGVAWWQDMLRPSITLMEQALSIAKGIPSMVSREASQVFRQNPLTIFDPEIVQDLLEETQTLLTKEITESPARFLKLQQEFCYKLQALWWNTYQRFHGKQVTTPVIAPAANDKRFRDPAWQNDPYFDFVKQFYLLRANFLKDLLANIKGLDQQTRQKIKFYIGFFIDAVAPTNFFLSNPTVLKETVETQGRNLLRGLSKLSKDLRDSTYQLPLTDFTAFKVGSNLATTPGKIVYQNSFFQLIQYLPQTAQVAQTPLLIVPPWINKYYILDLQPDNSFINWMVASGLTVFVMSWVNPDERYAETTFQDYVLAGVDQAVECVKNITAVPQINVFGYCAGGIALTTLLAYKARKKSYDIKSSTILATPIDTAQAGELMVYVCERQLAKLATYMQGKGYLSGQALGMSFNMLRANDLIWSTYINNYLLGRDPFPFDMLYWNSDSTRLPARMHLDYLRDFFLENRLLQKGPRSFHLNGERLDLSEITVPHFIFGTEDDHIAPWKSLYPLAHCIAGQACFVLGGSGHVAGVINPPAKEKYGYRLNADLPQNPNCWLAQAKQFQGSWWPYWRQWLEAFNDGLTSPRQIDNKRIIEDAPGRYVMAE